jgi:predicted nucleic acid-binding protein
LRNPPGPNGQIRTAARNGVFHLLASPAIISEVARVLRRSHWEEARIQLAIRRIAQVGEVVFTSTKIHALTADPDDNRILECAVDGKADLIVSNDHHLLALKEWERIPIIAGPDFRRMILHPRRTTK